MRYSTAIIVAAMSIGGEVVAGPTHAHLHRNAHQKKGIDYSAIDYATIDWDALDINWASAYAAGQASKTAAAAAPAATSAVATAAAAAAPIASAATAALKHVSSTFKSDAEALFGGLVGLSNSRTSFGSPSGSSGVAGDFYVGNYGVPYGSNIIKVDSTDGYDFTNTFVNSQSSAITVNIWNKVGSDFQPLSGSALAPKSTTLTFKLAPGAQQTVAFMADSQVAWAEAVSTLATSGAFATTWGEANFLTAGSGYDVSAIMNPVGNTYNMSIKSAEAPDCTSDHTQNYWLTATEPIGNSDGSCYIAQSTARLTTVLGGTI